MEEVSNSVSKEWQNKGVQTEVRILVPQPCLSHKFFNPFKLILSQNHNPKPVTFRSHNPKEEEMSNTWDDSNYVAFVAYGDTANPANFIIVFSYVQHNQ
jgi:hypothetical protein